MSTNPALFKQLLVVAAIVTIWSVWHRLSLIRLGRPSAISGSLVSRILDVIRYGFIQERVAATPFGYNHIVLFWSFLLLLIHHPMVAGIETVISGTLPSGNLIPYPKGMLLPVIFILDLLALLGLAAAVIAIGRRIISPPYPEGRTFISVFMPVLFVMIYCAYFGVNAFKINEFLSGEAQGLARHWLPVSSAIAVPLAGVSSENFYGVSWWSHGIAALLLIFSLPHGKFLHIITSLPNILLRRQEHPLLPPREEFTEDNRFGTEQVDQYTRKELLDAFTCTECGRCENACPASLTGKPLNPRRVIEDIRVNLLTNGPLLRKRKEPAIPLISDRGTGSVPEDAIWCCITCGACLEACPLFIEQMPKIIKMRRHLVEMKGRFPEELLNLFENMEGRSNPWGIAPWERTKWCSQLAVKPFEKNTTEYLFYVGCAGSFDSRNKQVSLVIAQLLDRAGVTWGILGKDEKCCGDTVRRLGNEYIFDQMAQENVAIFRERGVKKVITQCPHCFSTLKNDYRQYGIDLEVIHHSELLRNLVQEGRLTLDRGRSVMGNIVYHDPCYLGRHNDVYDAPREAIEMATGSTVTEMVRNHSKAFCCGAGGGRMWMEELAGERINQVRVKEALKEKPDTICVTCPYCMTMLEDGLKDLKATSVKVLDVAEVLAAAMRPA